MSVNAQVRRRHRRDARRRARSRPRCSTTSTPHVQRRRDHRRDRPARARLHGQRAAHDPGDAQLRAARAYRPIPASICTSVNHVVCHGIPGDKKLKDGDIVNIDVTVIKDGFHGDTSRMFYVGKPSIQAQAAVDVTYEAMWRGIRAVDAGRASRRHRRDDPALSPKATASRSCASSAATASAASSTRSRRCCTTGAPGTGLKLQPGMIFTDRADDQRRPAGHPLPRRRLDDRHRRPLAVGAMGAHGARHRTTASRC